MFPVGLVHSVKGPVRPVLSRRVQCVLYDGECIL